MPKAGYTEKPCPGCGEEILRKKDSVCPNCHALLETAREHKKLYEELKVKDGMIECKIPFGWDVPRFYTMRSNQHNESLKPLGEILAKLSRLVSVPKGKRVHYSYMSYLDNRLMYEQEGDQEWGEKLPVIYKTDSGKWKFQGDVVMPEQIFNCLNELSEAIEEAISGTEKSAVEYGKNALLMLQNGHITMKEFNEK